MKIETIAKHLRNHFFFYILAPLMIIVSAFSYFRFIINNDYLIGYEGTCNPATEKCFTGCTDDACTESYYYSQMIKYAPDLYKECGKDITDCEAANTCLPEDRNCSITYCDPEVDGDICSTRTEETTTQDNSQTNPTGEDLLPSNSADNTNI